MSNLPFCWFFAYQGHAITCEAEQRPDGRHQARVAVKRLLGARAVSQRFLDVHGYSSPDEALSRARTAACAYVDQYWSEARAELGRSLPLRVRQDAVSLS